MAILVTPWIDTVRGHDERVQAVLATVRQDPAAVLHKSSRELWAFWLELADELSFGSR
jgi:hypothetical protein